MIEYKRGDMFTTSADALAVAVNCVGVMGAGQAKQFAQHYPSAAQYYYEDCAFFAPQAGDVWKLTQEGGKDLVAVATKNDWRNPSTYEFIVACVRNLHFMLEKHYELGQPINTIAVPRLGCGLGGLKWSQVEPLFQEYFEQSPWTVEIWTH